MTGPRRVVIVGAGAAGLTTAEALRARGYDGTLALIGDEPHPPYDRPPLSKQILAGTWEPDRIALRGADALAGLDADLLLGRCAVGLEVAARRVLLDGGDRIDYDALVIATGATARGLPGADLAGIHRLRGLDDALALRAHLLDRPAVVVVGAGFLGAEVAAVARQLSLDVTLIDPLPTPLFRQFGHRIGALAGRLHTDHGVSVRCGTGLHRFRGATGRVTGVELTDGTTLDADLVVVAVGAAPALGWLAGSGLPVGDGIECDTHCQAAPRIYAAGDIASWHNNHFDTRMRLEHRMNATEQATAVAGNLLGAHRPFEPPSRTSGPTNTTPGSRPTAPSPRTPTSPSCTANRPAANSSPATPTKARSSGSSAGTAPANYANYANSSSTTHHHRWRHRCPRQPSPADNAALHAAQARVAVADAGP